MESAEFPRIDSPAVPGQDASMFRVEITQGDQWKIVVDNASTVFIGTMREAEDWLDSHENVQRQPATAGGWFLSVVDLCRRLAARPFPARGSPPVSRLTVPEFRQHARDH